MHRNTHHVPAGGDRFVSHCRLPLQGNYSTMDIGHQPSALLGSPIHSMGARRGGGPQKEGGIINTIF